MRCHVLGSTQLDFHVPLSTLLPDARGRLPLAHGYCQLGLPPYTGMDGVMEFECLILDLSALALRGICRVGKTYHLNLVGPEERRLPRC